MRKCTVRYVGDSLYGQSSVPTLSCVSVIAYFTASMKRLNGPKTLTHAEHGFKITDGDFDALSILYLNIDVNPYPN